MSDESQAAPEPDMKYNRVPTENDSLQKFGGNVAIQRIWKGINVLMMIFFLFAALVNYNDVDWYLWIPIYLVPAILCLPIILNPLLSENSIVGALSVIHFTLCIAYSIYQVILMIEAINGQLVNPLSHEEGRELGGLLLIITWLGISRFTSLGRPQTAPANRSMMNVFILMSITLAFLPMLTWGACFISDWHQKLGHCKDMFMK